MASKKKAKKVEPFERYQRAMEKLPFIEQVLQDPDAWYPIPIGEGGYLVTTSSNDYSTITMALFWEDKPVGLISLPTEYSSTIVGVIVDGVLEMAFRKGITIASSNANQEDSESTTEETE